MTVDQLVETFEELKRLSGMLNAVHNLAESNLRQALIIELQNALDQVPGPYQLQCHKIDSLESKIRALNSDNQRLRYKLERLAEGEVPGWELKFELGNYRLYRRWI